MCLIVVFFGFIALGTWQVKRLFWKLDLIERVNTRVHAAAVAAPVPASWPQINADGYEYLHVRVRGTYLYALTARVQASTELGGGYWLLTPLRGEDGNFYFINRGYVTGSMPDVQASLGQLSKEVVEVSGLLRISEPRGAFLRHNDPAGDRWYSRDVDALARARKLDPVHVAPYFIDAEASGDVPARTPQMVATGEPVPGLTVINFHNSHLVYAFTWYALAIMTAGAGFWIVRDERRRRAMQANSPIQDQHDGKQAN